MDHGESSFAASGATPPRSGSIRFAGQEIAGRATHRVVAAGIASVGRGQWEAAAAAGFSWPQTMRHIIAPQALRVILPPSVGVFITTLKESSLASIIGYIELTRTGLLVRDSTGGGFLPLLALGAVYFVINYAISQVGAALERRYTIHLVLRRQPLQRLYLLARLAVLALRHKLAILPQVIANFG